MRNTFLMLVTTFMVSGCSFIFPIPHDPAMFDRAVELQYSLDNTTCKNKDWSQLEAQVDKIGRYTKYREDPQSENLQQMKGALEKAKSSSNEKFCESVLKLQRSRMDVIFKAWSGR